MERIEKQYLIDACNIMYEYSPCTKKEVLHYINTGEIFRMINGVFGDPAHPIPSLRGRLQVLNGKLVPTDLGLRWKDIL